MKQLLLIAFLFYGFMTFVHAQTSTELLRNPSFEGKAGSGGSYYDTQELPEWTDLEIFPNQSTIDVHSGDTKFWMVSKAPYHGETYVGLVTRKNGSYEAIYQQLSALLEKDSLYEFEIYFATAEKYESPTTENRDQLSSFVSPIRFCLGGFNDGEEDMDVILESKPIQPGRWEQLKVQFRPARSLQNLVLQAYFINDEFPQNGHILIDHASLKRIHSTQ